jgi:hypothetical protein
MLENRFIVGTTNGQPGYIVYDDERRTTVAHTRTRKKAETMVARYGDATIVHRHISDLPTGTRISLEEKQKQLRQKEEFRSDPDLTIADIAIKHSISTDVVLEIFKDEPGVINLGPRLCRVPRAVHNRVMNRATVK